MTFKVELLTGDSLVALWPQIEPIFARCCETAAKGELDAGDILRLALENRAYVFVETDEGKVTVAIAMELIPYPKFMAANIFALGGHGLMEAKSRWWKAITEWMKANGVKTVDAWVSASMKRILERRFGFEQVYHHMRMPLGD